MNGLLTWWILVIQNRLAHTLFLRAILFSSGSDNHGKALTCHYNVMSSDILKKTIHLTSIAIYSQIVLFDLLLLISYYVPNLYTKPLHSSVHTGRRTACKESGFTHTFSHSCGVSLPIRPPMMRGDLCVISITKTVAPFQTLTQCIPSFINLETKTQTCLGT